MAVFTVNGEYGVGSYGTVFFGGTSTTKTGVLRRVYFLVYNEAEIKVGALTAASITASNTKTGFFSNIRALATGTGSVSVSGPSVGVSYSGDIDRTIVFFINDKGDGSVDRLGGARTDGTVGAKYWFSIDNGKVWYSGINQAGYSTSNSIADTPAELKALNVYLTWNNASTNITNSFVTGDRYTVIGNQQYNVTNLLQWDSTSHWKAGSQDANIDINLGTSGTLINSFALHDHNLTYGSNDTVHLQASALPDYSTLAVNELCTLSQEKTCGFVFTDAAKQYQYWRIKLHSADAAVTPEAGHLFLGRSTQLSKDINKTYAYSQKSFLSKTQFQSGRTYESVKGIQKYYQGDFNHLNIADRDTILTWWNEINVLGKPTRPFYIVNLPDNPEDYMFAAFTQDKTDIEYQLRNRFRWAISLRQAY